MIRQIKEGLFAIREGFVFRNYTAGRVLFDHLPKCAGSAIDTYLGAQYPRRHVFKTDPNFPRESVAKFRKMSEIDRFRYRLVVGHMAHDLVELVHPETTKLTILREPIDRIVSHYYYVLQQDQHYLHDRVVGENIKLEQYATLGLSEELSNWYTTHFTGWTLDEVNRNPTGALKCALEVVTQKYDIVGFQNDLPGVAEQIRTAARFTDAFENAMTNQTRKRLSLREISDEARKSIGGANAVDLDLYSALERQFASRSFAA